MSVTAAIFCTTAASANGKWATKSDGRSSGAAIVSVPDKLNSGSSGTVPSERYPAESCSDPALHPLHCLNLSS